MAFYQLGTRVDDEVAEMLVSFLTSLEGDTPNVDIPAYPMLEMVEGAIDE